VVVVAVALVATVFVAIADSVGTRPTATIAVALVATVLMYAPDPGAGRRLLVRGTHADHQEILRNWERARLAVPLQPITPLR